MRQGTDNCITVFAQGRAHARAHGTGMDVSVPRRWPVFSLEDEAKMAVLMRGLLFGTMCVGLAAASAPLPVQAAQAFAEAIARGSDGAMPINDFDQQVGVTAAAATAAVAGALGSGSAESSVDVGAGTMRFVLQSSGPLGEAAARFNLLDTLNLSVPGAAPGTLTPFSLNIWFNGTPTLNPLDGGYLITFREQYTGTHIVGSLPNGTVREFDDGLFQDPARPAFAPLLIDVSGFIQGPTAALIVDLRGTASVFRESALAFGSTIALALTVPPGTVVLSEATGGSPGYAHAVPVPGLAMACALVLAALPVVGRRRVDDAPV